MACALARSSLAFSAEDLLQLLLTGFVPDVRFRFLKRCLVRRLIIRHRSHQNLVIGQRNRSGYFSLVQRRNRIREFFGDTDSWDGIARLYIVRANHRRSDRFGGLFGMQRVFAQLRRGFVGQLLQLIAGCAFGKLGRQLPLHFIERLQMGLLMLLDLNNVIAVFGLHQSRWSGPAAVKMPTSRTPERSGPFATSPVLRLYPLSRGPASSSFASFAKSPPAWICFRMPSAFAFMAASFDASDLIRMWRAFTRSGVRKRSRFAL